MAGRRNSEERKWKGSGCEPAERKIMEEVLTGKTVLITGGTGSLGRKLTERILECQPKKLIIFSRDEFKQSEMARAFPEPRYFLGDVRDVGRLNQALAGVDYVIHAAALKQVPALEYNPEEAIKTNIQGSMNVISACNANDVRKCVFVSTDKAVNPVNLYGATKLCAEKLFIAANAYNKTEFVCVRYGNVIGSRGSVIPLFEKLRESGIKKVPITSPDMTRFWLTLDEAANLVMLGLNISTGGWTLIPRAPAMKITDVARAIIPDCEFEIIGVRPGEKIHESLVSGDMEKVSMVSLDCTAHYPWDRPYTSDKAKQMDTEVFLAKVNHV